MRRQMDQFPKKPGSLLDIVFFDCKNSVIIKAECQRRHRVLFKLKQKFLHPIFRQVKAAIRLSQNVAEAGRQTKPHSLIQKTNASGIRLERIQIFRGFNGRFFLKSGIHNPKTICRLFAHPGATLARNGRRAEVFPGLQVIAQG